MDLEGNNLKPANKLLGWFFHCLCDWEMDISCIWWDQRAKMPFLLPQKKCNVKTKITSGSSEKINKPTNYCTFYRLPVCPCMKEPNRLTEQRRKVKHEQRGRADHLRRFNNQKGEDHAKTWWLNGLKVVEEAELSLKKKATKASRDKILGQNTFQNYDFFFSKSH